MLVAGLYLFYRSESAQTSGVPLLAEAVEVSGLFTGLSVIKSGGAGRHYLWLNANGRDRGPRITAQQATVLQSLDIGQPVLVRMAPTVKGSKTLWAFHVEQHDNVLLSVADEPEE